MSMMGKLKFFLILQVHQSPRGIFISQSQYAIELLKKHGLDECLSMSTPMATERLDADLQGTPTDQTTYRRMIGGLMYLTASRPDIAFATFYPKDSGFELISYSDADHAGCKDDCKSTSGGLQFLGGKLVNWSSKKQDYTAMSTAEAEYVSLSACCAQVIWMRTQLLDYGYKYNRIPMYCDSKSAIAISCNPVQHSKTKHIDIRYHFIKEHVEKGTVEIYFVGTEYQLADLFTKALPKERFEYLVHRIVIIMAQQQHAAEVHPDELCPPNKRYDLMDANKKVDLEQVQYYAELLWEGLYYSLHHPTSLIPYLRFTNIIISHYMTSFLEILRRARNMYHNLMYTKVFGLDVPLTQSQPTESTQGTHRIPSTPRSPNPKMDTSESSTLKQSIVIHFRLPERRSTRLTLPDPVPIVVKADETILQDTLQVSLAEHKSREEQEARENVELVNKHLASKEIEKMMEGSENVIDDSLPPRNDEPNIPGTRLEPRSDKESPEVEITNDEEVEITNVVIPVNVNEEEEEITDEVYELKRREKGKIVEESRSTPFPTPIRSPRIHTDLVSSDTEKLQELTGRYTYLFEHLKARFLSRKSFDTLADHLQEVMVESLPTMVDTYIKEQVKKQVPQQVRDQVPVYVAEGLILERQKIKEEMEQMIAKAVLQERGNIQAKIFSQIQKAIDNHIPSQVDALVRSYMSGHILHVHPVQSQTPSVPEQQYQLYLSMKNDSQLQQQDIAIWLALQIKFKNLQVPQTTCRPSVVRPRDQDYPYDDAHPEGENHANRKKTSEYEAYMSGESSSVQVNEEERCLSTLGNQEQVDDYDFWTDSYSSDDDEIPTKQVSQDIMEEVSLTIDEANDIVWESRKEILISPHPQKTTPLVQSCQRDPEAPALSLINQDLLYLKKGSLGPEKIVLSLHKFLNPHAKIFYIRKQKEPGKPKEVIYSNSKIIQVIKTYWELGHEHKFITEIVARRANECIMSITEPDYKNLNKNDIEDMYLLIMNGKVPDYAETGLLWSLSVFIRSSVIWERVHDFQLGIESYQQKVNLTAPTISFPGVEKHKMFSIIYEPMHGIIYKNSKKEKRVMRHSEIHKFCDATLIRVLEGLKSYNNDVKYGYVQRELINDEVEYLKLFEEEIKVRLKYHNQMRRWEMYVNGRPLGPRRERPE
ncbi:hypothetical protein Tco_0791454 [Tanacetum coccineum]